MIVYDLLSIYTCGNTGGTRPACYLGEHNDHDIITLILIIPYKDLGVKTSDIADTYINIYTQTHTYTYTYAHIHPHIYIYLQIKGMTYDETPGIRNESE